MFAIILDFLILWKIANKRVFHLRLPNTRCIFHVGNITVLSYLQQKETARNQFWFNLELPKYVQIYLFKFLKICILNEGKIISYFSSGLQSWRIGISNEMWLIKVMVHSGRP